MKLGFIGTGALTSAIVTGLKSLDGDPVSVVLSPRNEEIAANLASRYPNIRVAADNQAVLDDCDTVMLAMVPITLTRRRAAVSADRPSMSAGG
ncbi:NAD(P)-binding domain-containing protein [Mesorhizobium japonicum]|uniref:NAD(P)-binding domain-containing protein n=1 Tax=Mesorhizobium japonicum TaxID=2066070 RepID=UPI001FCB3F14|nr:NAD(P)-binding domain-containing protein [Mesorhizobium japonicum]